MFGHASWMQKRGCYIDTGDTVNGGGAPALDTDTDGVEDSLDTDPGDDEGEADDTGGETGTEDGEPDVDAAQETKPDKPKQTPEFDAVAAQLRREKERAAQLERELQARHEAEVKQSAEKAQADQKAAIEQEWNAVLRRAEQLKAAGYGDEYVNDFVESRRASIVSRLEIQDLKQKLDQSQKQAELANQREQGARAVKYFFGEINELRKEYGDLVPDTKGIKEDVDGYFQYVKLLPPEMIDRIARGYSPSDAFKTVNYSKLASHEKSMAQKRTLANVSDRLKRGITSGSEGETAASGVAVNREMAEAFGTDPKKIAKYVKKHSRR